MREHLMHHVTDTLEHLNSNVIRICYAIPELITETFLNNEEIWYAARNLGSLVASYSKPLRLISVHIKIQVLSSNQVTEKLEQLHL